MYIDKAASLHRGRSGPLYRTGKNHVEPPRALQIHFQPVVHRRAQKYEVEGRNWNAKTSGRPLCVGYWRRTQSQQGVLTVIETRQSKGKFESTLFTDLDGDGLFTEAVELEVF